MCVITPIVKCWHISWHVFLRNRVSCRCICSVILRSVLLSLMMCQLIVQWVIEYEDYWCFSQAEVCESVFQWCSPNAWIYLLIFDGIYANHEIKHVMRLLIRKTTYKKPFRFVASFHEYYPFIILSFYWITLLFSPMGCS